MSLLIIFALLASAGLFAGYMWIYISPLIKDKNVVAPHSTTIAVSKGGFQETQRRAGASRQNLRSVTNSRAKNRSTLPESPSSDESSHEDVKSLGRHAPQYVHTYGRDFLEPGFHTRPPNTSLKRPRGTLSPITPPPPAYVSQPSTPTPDYGFTDAYSDRSFGSPTPSSNERYPYRPSLSDHSPPRPETRSFSVQTNPLYAPIGLGRPRSGSQSSSSRTFSQGNSDSSLSATSQTESGSSNGCHSYPGSGHTSPSSFSIPSYYHTIRSIPSGSLAPGYPPPPIPTPRPQQVGAYHQSMHAQVFQLPSSPTLIPPPMQPRPGHFLAVPPPPLRPLDTSLVPSFPPGHSRGTRF